MDRLFESINDEVSTPVEGIVIGTVPEWLSGSLIRNGSAMFQIGECKYKHQFDGLAAIQKFDINDGKVTYQRKFVKSESYQKNMSVNKIVVNEFGTPAYFPDPYNTAVSVWPLKDRLFASTETNRIHEIDPENLDTLDRTKIHIIDKKTGEEVNVAYTYQSSSCLVFHHGNAYEEDGFIVMDLCRFPDSKILNTTYLSSYETDKWKETMKNFPRSNLCRFIIPLNLDEKTPKSKNLVTLPNEKATAVLTENNSVLLNPEFMSDIGFELCTINYPKYNGVKYRYMYGCCSEKNCDLCLGTLAKFDVETRTYKTWKEEDRYPTEPIFAPNPDGTDEDDGVILAAIHSLVPGKNPFLLILDGKTFTEKARVEFPDLRFVKDIHGMFRAKPKD
ncbi:hypothetical protein KUTeg_017028 [Tegillarca granosa]|uniref:Uncharacterized protein n=1 Tax=Tegillarca granosa TaxID=220873 RepID=A0ABQ9EMK4_TEGGR|nr:hypothetical protein KUTeg_017028 [Tegillarca granosa]